MDMRLEARTIRREPTATPELLYPLEGLKLLDVDDLHGYGAAVSAGRQMGWKYYFPYLLSLNRTGQRAVLYTEEAGSACVFLWQIEDLRPRLDVYLAPAPMSKAVLRRCIERANEFNGDLSARVMRIDAKDVDAVAAAGVHVPRASGDEPRLQQEVLPLDRKRCQGAFKILAQHLIEGMGRAMPAQNLPRPIVEQHLHPFDLAS